MSPVTTIDEYIAAFPLEVQKILAAVRTAVRKAAPHAEEKISWRMPTYYQGGNLVHFAAYKNHLGFYPGSEGIEAFAGELAPYVTSKGAVQFPYSRPVPLSLIAKITRFRAAQIKAGKPAQKKPAGKTPKQ